MSRSNEVKCDACGFDLTYTGNCEDWFLVVGNEEKQPWYVRDGLRGGAVTSLAVEPPIDRTHHFCGLQCLAKWMSDNHHDALAGYDKLQEHRAWIKQQHKRTEKP